MPTIAHVILSRPDAKAFAYEADGRTAQDVSYVVKGALARFLGDDHGIRPYRIFEEEDVIRVVGFVGPDRVRQPGPESKDVVVNVEFLPWASAKNDEVFLDVLVCPMTSIDKGDRKSREVDVGRAPGVTDPLMAYSNWIVSNLNKADTGCVSVAAPRFTSTEHFEAVRKVRGPKSASCPRCHNARHTVFDPGMARWTCTSCDVPFFNTKTIRMPSVHAMAKVRVVNPPAFERFLRTGIGRQRAFGYGSLVPSDVLDQLEL